MNIHEYQGKSILKSFGVSIQEGIVAETPDQAVEAAKELKTEEHTHYLNKASESIAAYFLRNSIIIRPLGNILYLIPPYCISEKELRSVFEVIEAFLDQI